jgi:hypothetical protein
MGVLGALKCGLDYSIKYFDLFKALSDEINDLKNKGGDARLKRIQLLQLKQSLELSLQFYNVYLFQSRVSFAFAILAAFLGIISFLIGAYLCIKEKDPNTITLLGTAVCSVVSGIGFYLYKESSRQISYAFDKLENLQKMLYKSQTSNKEDINIR